MDMPIFPRPVEIVNKSVRTSGLTVTRNIPELVDISIVGSVLSMFMEPF